MSTKQLQAKEGIKVFFPLDVKAAPGRRTFILSGDEILEIDTEERFVRRMLRCGDLVVVKTTKVRGDAPAKPKRETRVEKKLDREPGK